MNTSIIGIDFGTTKCVAAAMIDGHPVVIPDEAQRRLMPSMVAVRPDRTICVGWDAVNLTPMERWSSQCLSIAGIKRLLGKQGKTSWGALTTYPQEIAALLMGRIRLYVEAWLDNEVSKVVLATPACFGLNERHALRDAAEIAGFEVLRFIHEPTAAALAYGLNKSKSQTVAVFDLGGGTVDVSILEIGEGVFEVKASRGEPTLGGMDFTQAIAEHFRKDFEKSNHGVFLGKHPHVMARLMEAADQAKRDLSSQSEVRVVLPHLMPDGSPNHLDCHISQAQFQSMTAGLQTRIRCCCQGALNDSGLSSVNAVVMVGAATRMPCMRPLLNEVFGQEPMRNIDASEAVALGAAIQAGILAGEIKNTVLLDVMPTNFGVGMSDGSISEVTSKNTVIPVRKTRTFTTTQDNQSEIDIRIYQGGSKTSNLENMIGTLRLSGLAPTPKGLPQIEVAFDIDVNGVLSVSAKDNATDATVKSVFDRLLACLNPAQRNILSKRVAEQLNVFKCQRDIHKARERAENLLRNIDSMLDAGAIFLDAPTTDRLRDGCALIRDCLDRRMAPGDLNEMVLRIHAAYNHGCIEWRIRSLDNLCHSEAYQAWLAETATNVMTCSRNEVMRQLHEKCGEALRSIRRAWSTGNRSKGLNAAVESSRIRKHALELISRCLDLSMITTKDWILEDFGHDPSHLGLIAVLACIASERTKRMEYFEAMCRSPYMSQIPKLIQIVARETDPDTRYAMGETLVHSHHSSLWDICRLSSGARTMISLPTELRQIVAKSALNAVRTEGNKDALDALERLGLNRELGLARDVLSTLQDEAVILRILRLLLDQPSEQTSWACLESVGRFHGAIRALALEGLRNQDVFLRWVLVHRELNSKLRRQCVFGALIAMSMFDLRISLYEATQVLDESSEDEIVVSLLELAARSGDKATLYCILSKLTSWSVPVWHFAQTIVDKVEFKATTAEKRLFKIASLVLREGGRPRLTDRRFVRRMATKRLDCQQLFVRVCETLM